jgi:hypothetical protein
VLVGTTPIPSERIEEKFIFLMVCAVARIVF